MKKIADLSLDSDQYKLFLSYYGMIKTVAATKFVRNSDCDCDTLIQEISIKIIRLIKSGKLKNKSKGYVHTCIRNACNYCLRSLLTRFDYCDSGILNIIPSNYCLENVTKTKELVNILLSTLDDIDKTIICHYEGIGTNRKSMDLIASILGRSVTRVYKRKIAAMRALKNNKKLKEVAFNEKNI